MNKRRGISTFIATLLLMVLAVAAGIVIYAYVMGYLGGFGGTSNLGALSLDSVSSSTTQITAFVRNIGKTSVTVSTAYVNGVQVTSANLVAGGGGSLTISQNGVQEIDIKGQTLTAGSTYTVKLLCQDNTQISFDVKASS